VGEDLAHDRRVWQEGDDPHLAAALGAGERIDLVDAADQLSPRAAQAAAFGGPGLGHLGPERDLCAPCSRATSSVTSKVCPPTLALELFAQ
jgi:hypothetical protein